MSYQKPVVLVFVAYYIPGFRSGGPVRSIAGIVERLGHRFDFRIVTIDRDCEETIPYPNVKVGSWQQVGDAKVLYLPASAFSLISLIKLFRKETWDVLYLNSFFSVSHSFLPYVAAAIVGINKRKVIVAPRGEFSPGALKIRSLRKRFYIIIANVIGLYRTSTWQASTAFESEDIERTAPSRSNVRDRIMVACDIPSSDSSSVPFPTLPHKPSEPLRIAYLSRITEKKNLIGALNILAQIDLPVQFSIYGTIENESYWQSCRLMIEKLPSNVHAEYKGIIHHSEVVSTLAKENLFLFPTFGENFGHVILEALQAGCMVALSDQTPWQDLEDAGVGWVIPLSDESKFVNAIRSCAMKSEEESEQTIHRCRAYAEQITANPETIEANAKLFACQIQGT